MSEIIRQRGAVHFVGVCSQCGADRAVEFPATEHFEQTNGIWSYCHREACDQINWLERESG